MTTPRSVCTGRPLLCGIFSLSADACPGILETSFPKEPEQNLFPEAQRDLLFYLLTAINHGRNHRLVITTHSPYILYALNNCLMAYAVKNKMPKEEYQELDCKEVVLDSKEVAVWEIENGMMRADIHSVNGTIQDKDGLIRANYFNRIMQGIMSDFNNMLNYCEEDE